MALISYRTFIKKYIGRYANPDPRVPNQCVDLVNLYIKEVLGKTPIKGDAINFDVNYNPREFRYYRNTRTFVPKEGDIAVFGRLTGIHGHTDIVYSDRYHRPTQRVFWAFSQNWPLFSKSKIVRHYWYYGVKGFLRAR